MDMKKWLIIVYIGLLCCQQAGLFGSVREKGDQLVVGEVVKVHSDILGEERTVWIRLPGQYHETDAKYPVFYMLDGKCHFLHVCGIIEHLSRFRMPEMIVVAIDSRDRAKDFLPSRINDVQSEPAADQFMAFIRDELIPHIDKNYRTVHSRALCGHSFAGLFTIHFMLKHPDAFTAFLAVSPSLYWDKRLVFREAEAAFKNNPGMKTHLYLSSAGGDREAIRQANLDFETLLREKAPSHLQWRFHDYKEEDHGSTVHPAIYRALETHYTGWSIPKERLSEMTIAEVRGHYTGLSERFGYDIPVPLDVLHAHSVLLIRTQRLDDALDTINFHMGREPENPVVYFRQGTVYELQEKIDLARSAYENAVKLGEKTSHRHLTLFKKILAELTAAEQKDNDK